MKALLEGLPVAVAVANAADGRILYANGRLDTLLGLASGSAQGTHIESHLHLKITLGELEKTARGGRAPRSRTAHGSVWAIRGSAERAGPSARVPGSAGAALSWSASAGPVYALVHEIGLASTRNSEIVKALRSYSYLGQAPVQMVDLREGLDNTLVMLRNKLKAGIRVHQEYDETVPRVPAYGSELNQVWTNLLDNAADAMGGKGEITIRTGRDGAWAVVEIEDNGPGIPESIQSRIFDPFFTTKAPGKGTGLGLSTSYGIVKEKHGGEIRVDSRPGFTRFTVRLPLYHSQGEKNP